MKQPFSNTNRLCWLKETLPSSSGAKQSKKELVPVCLLPVSLAKKNSAAGSQTTRIASTEGQLQEWALTTNIRK